MSHVDCILVGEVTGRQQNIISHSMSVIIEPLEYNMAGVMNDDGYK